MITLEQLWPYGAVWVAAMSGLALCLMALDKGRAKAGAWRLPERTLLLVAALGGAPGGLLGMYLFHHKTRHRAFRYGLPAILLGQTALLLWLCRIR